MLIVDPIYLFLFNFLVGIILGHILNRGDFCIAGIIRDIFLFKDYTLFRALMLLIIVQIPLFYLGRILGLIHFYPPPTYHQPSLGTALGGLIFGIGMVLAGGCVVSTLYKMAKGNLTNFLAFIGIVVGSLIYAEMHPFWETFRKSTLISHSIFIKGSGVISIFLVLTGLLLFYKWKKEGKWKVFAYAQGYIQPWKVALIFALLNFMVYIFSGWPMGITTAYAKIGAYIEKLILPEYINKVLYFSQDSLVVVSNNLIISGGAGPKVDLYFYTELALLLGILLGSFLTSLYLREFKIYGFPPLKQACFALVGGIMVGYGARVALGCNLKYLVGALPLLTIESILFAINMTLGAFLGSMIIKKFLI